MISNYQKEIEEAIPKLLDLARQLSWNTISNRCQFILSEIKDSEQNFDVKRVTRIKENAKKIPVSLSEMMPTLQNLYVDMYDINLHIHRADSRLTVVDIRYYLKSSLDPECREKIGHTLPMLHCKVATPPWLSEKKEKFDINWEHKQWMIRWKQFWTRRKVKALRG
jgi:hypothetical protein